jgi:hypothetical protein
MNLRWLLGNYADPEFTLTRQQQREVTRLAHKRYLRPATLGITTGGLLLASFLLIAFGLDLFAGALASLGIQPARLFARGLLCVGCVLLGCWVYRFIYVKPVRCAMRDLGYDLCIGCGYRLQGLPDAAVRCPECGAVRELVPKNTPVNP